MKAIGDFLPASREAAAPAATDATLATPGKPARTWPERIAAAASRGRGGAAPAPAPAPTPTPPDKMISWPEHCRAIPNCLLRSALFAATGRGSGGYVKEKEIYSQKDMRIFYTGGQLDQAALTVYDAVLHVMRSQQMGVDVRVTGYQLLKVLGRQDTGGNRRTLHGVLMMLKATAVDVHAGRYSYAGSLLDEVYKDDDTREYVIRLNPKLLPLFTSDQYTRLDEAVRRRLEGQPLAQWLHGYYSSHRRPFPIKIETLYHLSGSRTKRIRDFKKDMIAALACIAAAAAAEGHDFTHAVDGDLVSVTHRGDK